MTTVTESDIKELKDLIVAFREETGSRFTTIETRLASLEGGQQNLQLETREVRTKLNTLEPSINKIPDLAEKVGELKNWKQIGLVFVTAVVSSIFSGIIGGVIGWLIRSGKA
ncbi:hypothetical protein [Iningainema tapete]|uniref:Uncharacterized protein n=1 Tax=Iningainema tapete BLCC-T55 TaxID=2748662 RepID=A0A8J6XBU4_9CYAN|nr:hypothetical protein [Iningainema tapete]MBD2772460.1 hypothetical protein [Iningainema tapete BLCC-T55]